MAFVGQISLNQVLKLGRPYWKIELDNWGNEGADADANSLIYDIVPENSDGVGASIVTIAPDSTVDAVQLVSFTESEENLIHVGVGAPAVLATNVYQILAGGSFYSPPTAFEDTYLAENDATPQTFGTALGGFFETPTLRLLWYVSAIPPMLSFYQRTPMVRNATLLVTSGTTERIVHVWPVSGRNSITIVASGYAIGEVPSLIGTVRIETISSTPNIGRTVVASGQVNTVLGYTVTTVITTPCAFVAVYFTRASGSGDINVKMVANDALGERLAAVEHA